MQIHSANIIYFIEMNNMLQTDQIKEIGEYRIELSKPLGQGSSGKVYRSQKINTNEYFAVKIIPIDRIADIKRQIDIVLTLCHPNITNVHEYKKSKSNHYFFMDLCVMSLEDQLIKRGRLAEEEAKKLFAQIVIGLEYLHSLNIVHRDLKPANILFEEGGGIKIADFGISKMMDLGNQMLRTVRMGTPTFMAPEIYTQHLYSEKSDIWSLGIIYFYMLFGYNPYRGCPQPVHMNEISLNTMLLKMQDISGRIRSLMRDQISKLGVNISNESLDFIEKCLAYNQGSRLVLSDVLKHTIFGQYFHVSHRLHYQAQEIMNLLKQSLYDGPENHRDLVQKLMRNTSLRCDRILTRQEFANFMSEASEFMDQTKSSIVFDYFKMYNEDKILIYTISYLLGFERKEHGPPLFTKSYTN